MPDRLLATYPSLSGRPVLVTLTKADKLTRSALPVRVRQLAAALDLPPEQIQLTSSRSRLGISELAGSIIAAGQEAR